MNHYIPTYIHIRAVSAHGGFNRIEELDDRIAAFIKARAPGKQAAARAREKER